jgi:hypothetical protein
MSLQDSSDSVESLEKTLQRAKAEKYDHKLENELREWIQTVLQRNLERERSFQELLKDGQILCE